MKADARDVCAVSVAYPFIDLTDPRFQPTDNPNSRWHTLKALFGLALLTGARKTPVRGPVSRHTLLVSEFMNPEEEDKATYSGPGTYLSYLPPAELPSELYRGKVPHFLDRLALKSKHASANRHRLNTVSDYGRDVLSDALQGDQYKRVVFVNIGGGTGISSLNILKKLERDHPNLMRGRRFDIKIWDIDSEGPKLGKRLLIEESGLVPNIDVTLEHKPFDWNETMYPAFATDPETYYLVVSQGGICEYAKDKAVESVMKYLRRKLPNRTRFIGSTYVTHPELNYAVRYLKWFSGLPWQLRGKVGMERLALHNGWEIARGTNVSDTYFVFDLAFRPQ